MLSEEEKVLNELYKQDIDIMCWYPQPSTVISKFSNVSLYKTRKILHKLKKEGIVEFERGYVPHRISYEGELEEESFFYCGWKLTNKGKNNNKYTELKHDNKILLDEEKNYIHTEQVNNNQITIN